ncbi:Hypp1008 [Branchiostoma lanceolatum]|uniref:Hypp1008 protein n=1 Tax=Branchiostoma lanceolatum TaxID=7740 RepID=A0A8J9ZF23_BRALA|nr:Hypp1008 [Branchiostoma lanceolatum]
MVTMAIKFSRLLAMFTVTTALNYVILCAGSQLCPDCAAEQPSSPNVSEQETILTDFWTRVKTAVKTTERELKQPRDASPPSRGYWVRLGEHNLHSFEDELSLMFASHILSNLFHNRRANERRGEVEIPQEVQDTIANLTERVYNLEADLQQAIASNHYLNSQVRDLTREISRNEAKSHEKKLRPKYQRQIKRLSKTISELGQGLERERHRSQLLEDELALFEKRQQDTENKMIELYRLVGYTTPQTPEEEETSTPPTEEPNDYDYDLVTGKKHRPVGYR